MRLKKLLLLKRKKKRSLMNVFTQYHYERRIGLAADFVEPTSQ